MQCTLGRIDCLIEFQISAVDSMLAVRNANSFNVDTPVAQRTRTLRIAVPDSADPDGPAHPYPAYPYIWKVIPETNTIQMEMGRDVHGKRIVALFSMKPNDSRFGVTVHLSVYLVDMALAEATGLDYGMASRHSIDTRYHLEANKHFVYLLLGRQDRHPSNNYMVIVPEVPPSSPDEFIDDIENL